MVSKDIQQKIFSLLDLTSLNDTDNAATIAALCHKACGSLGCVAAVCVSPLFVSDAVTGLTGTSIHVTTVANFPHGNDLTEKILASITHSIDRGADEIDVVFPYHSYLQGDKEGALEIMMACRRITAGRAILKVILETGVIDNLSTLETISRELILLEVDFLKTSTGKVTVGATIEAAAVMLNSIKESGAKVGFKASGGIRSYTDALSYIRLAEDIMGAEWVRPEHFRIGTSGLSE